MRNDVFQVSNLGGIKKNIFECAFSRTKNPVFQPEFHPGVRTLTQKIHRRSCRSASFRNIRSQLEALYVNQNQSKLISHVFPLTYRSRQFSMTKVRGKIKRENSFRHEVKSKRTGNLMADSNSENLLHFCRPATLISSQYKTTFVDCSSYGHYFTILPSTSVNSLIGSYFSNSRLTRCIWVIYR